MQTLIDSSYATAKRFDGSNAGQFDVFKIIENANSCGQGMGVHHAQNPFHEILQHFGWQYSHSTLITAVDGSKFAHLTYKLPGTDWSVGIDARPGFKIGASRGGSGRETVIFGAAKLSKYLQRKTRELTRELSK